MKFYRIAAVAIALLMLFSFTACQNNGDGTDTKATAGSTGAPSTKAPDTTKKAPESTKAPVTDAPATTAPAVVTTSEPETDAPLAVDTIPEAEMTVLRLTMPQSLPDGSNFDIFTRMMCCDIESDYVIKGHSAGSTKFIGEADGAVYGNAVRFAGKDDSKDKRGEITLQPATVRDVAGSKGILFYVDASNLIPAEGKEMCVSVTINNNNIRSQGPDKATGSAVAWYYSDGIWTQTTNINSCRLQIPQNFKGWLYVPATSFTQTNGEFWDVTTGCFNDNFFIDNMRCYTDGYTYSADSYIIFDEITFIK